MNKKIILNTIKEILEVAYMGLTSKSEKYIPPQSVLSSEAYESKKIVYRAHPIGSNKLNKK